MEEDRIKNYLDVPSSQLSRFESDSELETDNESLFGPDSEYDPEWVPDDLDLTEFEENVGVNSLDLQEAEVNEGDNPRDLDTELEENVVDTYHDLGQELQEVEMVDIGQPVEEREVNNIPDNMWGPVGDTCNLNEIPVNSKGESLGVNPDLIDSMMECSPIEFWNLFVSNDIIDTLVLETNRYAAQTIASKADAPPNARIKKWVDTDHDEMMKFMGIILYMGLCQLPTIGHYWRNDNLYCSPIANKISRNRFQLLLSLFHCSNNEEALPNDRLHKVQAIIDKFVFNFRMCVNPDENICIDESMIPFLGRIFFRQYVKGKRHKYGIKVFKLCTKDCYTLSFRVYSGKIDRAGLEGQISKLIVMELAEPYLDNGRTLYCDNWYTSVDLAQTLLNRATHLVGTLRKNRKLNPATVTKAKLRVGELIAQKNENNIVVLKWKDQREVLMLSTKHTDETYTMIRRGKEIRKPAVVVDYNKGKSLIDLADQMGSYSSPLRRSLKWYRKVVFELLLNTAVINALSVYKSVTGKIITITEFREQLVKGMVIGRNVISIDTPQIKHVIIKTSKPARCKICYKNLVTLLGRSTAQRRTRQVKTRCEACGINMCMTCFTQSHISKPTSIQQ